jgi:UDP-GlcNAc:undecaprenyl-phosphate GlcNAc-1-phosphate transferase
VLILWGWAALISFGSLTILFFKVRYVVTGMLMAAVVLSVLTLFPYLRRRIPELRQENESERGAQHAAEPRRGKRRRM